MRRIPLTDNNGRWFDPDRAESWDETTTWDGNNHISDATGIQWDHERLYRTASGRWILATWSNWQGVLDTYTEISAEEAAKWLVRCGHEVPELASEIAALEL